jgi:sugar O-acyltransferase (sialic acid O-acetyltransferase NeuD family)
MTSSAPIPLLIFPCNGNGSEALDCLGEAYRCIGFIDDSDLKQGSKCCGLPVYSRSALSDFPDAKVLAGPGSPTSYRERGAIIHSLGPLPTERFSQVVHPAARVSPLAQLGRNLLIMAGVVITSNVTVADHVCLLPNTVVHHDSTIGELTLVGSNVTVAGHVKVGSNCYIGSGSAIRNDLSIGDRALIGLGSTVVRNVGSGARVAGSPARVLSS